MSGTSFKRLFELGNIGGIEVKNRIIMAPMQVNLAGYTEGEINERIIKYYMRRAKGGVGLIVIGASAVDWIRGKSPINQKNISVDRHIPGWNSLAEEIQAYGTKTFVQIHHPGRQTLPRNLDKNQNPDEPDVTPVSASEVCEKFLGVQPRALETDEVKEVIGMFGDAAARVKEAGFDGVMIHGAHGYLVEQFMSPYTNKRDDEYGNSFENRLRFPLEVIEDIKKKCGADFPLAYRMSVEEYVPEGLHLKDSEEICPRLEEAGVDWIDVTAGIYQNMPTIFVPHGWKEAWRSHHAEAIKKVVDIPVSCVGNIRKPETAEEILRKGQADFIAIGRPLLADPDWPNKARQGKTENIRLCISCNYCIGDRNFKNKPVACAINPVCGREIRYSDKLEKSKHPKNVLVVGGGPAGMEAAWRASERGHNVTLYDDGVELGGKLLLSEKPPGKDFITWFKEWGKRQIAQSNVEVNLGVKVDMKMIRRKNPDFVILATGAIPLRPNWLGGERGIMAEEILSGNYDLRDEEVVIIGGGLVGCETALYLVEKGNKVVIIEMLEDYALDVEPLYRMHLHEKFEGRKELPLEETIEDSVKVRTGATVTKVNDSEVIIETDKGLESVGYDNLVISIGYRSNRKLERELRETDIERVVIGDAKEPRKIAQAVKEGFDAARILE